jgi:tetratricopeptide (TPR) repeat protein
MTGLADVLRLESEGRRFSAQSPRLSLLLQFTPADSANLAQVSKGMHALIDPCTKAFSRKATGNTHLRKGQYDSAIECYKNAIEHWPDNPTLHSNEALAHIKVCAYADALLSIASAVRLGGLNAKLLYRKAQAFYGLERWEDAVDCSLHAGKLKPNDKAIKKQIEKCAAKLTGYEEAQVKQEEEQGPEMWKCEHLCGFTGIYDDVVVHEKTCSVSVCKEQWGFGDLIDKLGGDESSIQDVTDLPAPEKAPPSANGAIDGVLQCALQERMFTQYPGMRQST